MASSTGFLPPNGFAVISPDTPNQNFSPGAEWLAAGYTGSQTWHAVYAFPIIQQTSTDKKIFKVQIQLRMHPSYSGWFKLYGLGTGFSNSGDPTFNALDGSKSFIYDFYMNPGEVRSMDFDPAIIQGRLSAFNNGGFAAYKYDANYFGYMGGASQFAQLKLWYGYPLTGLGVSNGNTRSLTASWNGTPGADRYSVWLNGTYQGTTTSTSWVWNNISAGGYSVAVNPHYDDFNADSFGQTVGGSVSNGQPAAPSATAQPGGIYRTAQINAPYGSYGFGWASWNYRLLDASNNVVASTNSGASQVTLGGTGSLPAGNLRAQIQAVYSDSGVSAWSGDSNTVTTTTPTITGTTATTTNSRSITATWNKMPDADVNGYQIREEFNGVWSGWTNVSQPATGPVTYTYSNIKGGTHNIEVKPTFTVYTGPTNNGLSTGTALIPTPNAPTAVGDSPAKRQIVATSPLAILPSAFFSAATFDFRRDTNDGTIVNTGGTSATLSAVTSGSHSVQIRARWSDGDVSTWSSAVTGINTTTPAVSSASSRQSSAPASAPACTHATTGGTINGGATPPGLTYYIAVSINKGGSKTTDAAHPDPTRPINESTISPLFQQLVANTTTTGTITVPKPAGMTGSDTWNVYIGIDKNVLRTAFQNQAQATTSVTITSFANGANQAKIGKVDILWVAPTGVGDAPTSYKVERAPAVPPNLSTGTPGTYVDVTPGAAGGTYAGIYSTVKYYQDRVDTAYYYYRIYAVYSNETAAALEIVV